MVDERAQSWETIDWQPKDLQVGDRVGLLINGKGEVWIVHNDRRVCKPRCKLNPDKDFYPVFDLLGNTAGITLLLGAQPPVGFHRALSGSYVILSSDGLTATHQDPTGSELKGVAFLSGPAPLFEEGAYFEVRLDEVCTGNPDGLTIGVTVQKPSLDDPEPATADDVPNSWSIGFDGQAKVAGKMRKAEWRPTGLRVGDRVGLFVDYRSQETWLVENGQFVEQLPGPNPPTDCPLYGFVDLLGNTTKVTLVERAAPPDSTGVRLVGKTSYTAGGFLKRAVSMIVDATLSIGVLSCFNRELVSSLVKISDDGCSAVHEDVGDDEMQGVLFGNAPIPRFDDEAQYFEVRIDSLFTGFSDGLVIGVTTALPALHDEPITCADEVPSSWTFGYDGSFAYTPPEREEEPEEEKEHHAHFRKNDSLYRVSLFSSSAFRVSLRSNGDGGDSEEEESDEEPGAPSTEPGRGRRTVAPMQAVSEAQEESD